MLRLLLNCHCVGYCVAPVFAGTYAPPAGSGRRPGGDRAASVWRPTSWFPWSHRALVYAGFGRVCPITAGLHREWAWSGMAAAAVACFSPVQQACCAQLRPSFPVSLRNAALAGVMFDPRPCISSSRADQPQSDLKKPKQLRRRPNKTNRCVEEPRKDSAKTQYALKDSCAEVTISPSPVNGVFPETGTTRFGRQALRLDLFFLVLI